MFSADNHAALVNLAKSVPEGFQGLREDIQKMNASIMTSMKASDERCEAQIKLANDRIDVAEKRITAAHEKADAIDRRVVKWTTKLTAWMGASACGIAIFVWAMKAVFKIG